MIMRCWPRFVWPWFVVWAVAVAACGDAPSLPVSPDPVDSVPPPQQGCGRTSVGFTPLDQPGAVPYSGQLLGLYPGGGNDAPGAHRAAGLAAARQIVPMDAGGAPSAAGRYAFVSIGMSNTTQEFSVFKTLSDADAARDQRLVVVDGAQGGMTASEWANPACACWTILESRLQAAGLAAPQVAAAWVKVANAQPTEGFPAAAERLRQHTAAVLRQLTTRFPNLRVAYLSSRIYAGYATSLLNPEPYAYESGFAVRWVIEDQLAGRLAPGSVPWLAWGPYLWADGLRPRADGLTWACSDFASDGTHPSAAGRRKVADLLLQFVRTDATAREWYLATP